MWDQLPDHPFQGDAPMPSRQCAHPMFEAGDGLVGNASPERPVIPHGEAEELPAPRLGNSTLLRVGLKLEAPFDEAGQALHDTLAGLFAANIDVASSSGGDLHPSALSEPDVRLSPHPAPTLQPPAARPAATGQT